MLHDYVNIWLDGDSVWNGFADHFRRPVALLPLEITALHVSLVNSLVSYGDQAEVRERLETLAGKIERALPPEQRPLLRESERLSVVDGADVQTPELETLRCAVRDCRKVEVDYLSWGESRVKRRVVHPYGIVVIDGVTYVPSHDENRGHVVALRLDRFDKVRLLRERFVRDPGFSLEAWAEKGSAAPRQGETEVCIRVTGRTARFLSETLDQRQWRWRDGDTLEVRLATSRPLGLVRWTLQLGPDAVIESPEAIRELAIDEIHRIRRVYVS